jgi:hypothetical protein
MSTDQTHAQAHKPRLVLSKDVHGQVHGLGAVGRFNTWLALKITGTVGTMWAAYAFALLTLISLPAAIATGSAIIIVAWIAQTFLQLVLLPIIIVGQNVIQATNDARAEADHETLIAIHTLTKAIDNLQLSQLDILRKLETKT